VSVDGKDFGEEVGRIDEAREKYKTEELLVGSLLEPIKAHVDRLRRFRTNRRSRKTDRALIVDKQERG
jgi:hypothetical protein